MIMPCPTELAHVKRKGLKQLTEKKWWLDRLCWTIGPFSYFLGCPPHRNYPALCKPSHALILSFLKQWSAWNGNVSLVEDAWLKSATHVIRVYAMFLSLKEQSLGWLVRCFFCLFFPFVPKWRWTCALAVVDQKPLYCVVGSKQFLTDQPLFVRHRGCPPP